MAYDQFGGIQIRNLYKIFGANAAQPIEAIKGGLSKTDLNAQFGLVLGLKNINIEIPSGRIQVVMGLSCSGKSTLIRHINRMIDPTAGEVLVDGADIVKMNKTALRKFSRPQTAMEFQKFALQIGKAPGRENV